MSRISELDETQEKINRLIEDYPEYHDPQSIQNAYLYEIAKSLAVIADHFTAEDEYMKKNAIEAFSDLLFQTNKTGEPSKE